MVRIKIDNKEIQVKPGTRVIDALREYGTDVPSMCYLRGTNHFTSCMVCMVKDARTGDLFPSCSYQVEEGMEIISGDEEVLESRKTALELLLSEHVGDCEAPCQITCPAHMDIPQMNRLLAEGKFNEALRVVKKDIALPSVFGRICPAPCESACRRKSIDDPVSICLLKRYAGDHDLAKEKRYLPDIGSPKNKEIAIIGSGPGGLAAAYYLAIRGYHCMIYDRNKLPGGSLRKEVSGEILPTAVLDEEIDIIRNLGVAFEQETTVDSDRFKKISERADAILIATGSETEELKNWGLKMTGKGVEADPVTFRIKGSNVFAVGSALKPVRLAIRVLGQGKEVAFSIDQYIRGEKVTGEPFMFNSRFGKLLPEEFDEYLTESVPDGRLVPSGSDSKGAVGGKEHFTEKNPGFSKEEVMKEAARCMHCDCRDLASCKLRLFADQYLASQKRFASDVRKPVTKQIQHDLVIYEPTKCIKCGICVRLTSEHKEEFGLTFIGRGFDVVVGIPFNESLKNGLKKIALEVADACPTGAICRKLSEGN